MARVNPIYRAATALIAGVAGAQNLLSIENPVAATPPNALAPVMVTIRRVYARGVANAGATTVFLYHLKRTTGMPTVGTVLAAAKRLTSDPAAQAIVRSGPTATPAAADLAVGQPGLVLTAAGFVVPTTDDLEPVGKNEGERIVLAPGEGAVVVADTNTTAWSHVVGIEWHEGTPILRVQ